MKPFNNADFRRIYLLISLQTKGTVRLPSSDWQMNVILNLILYIFLKLQVAYACWACNVIHVCKKSTDFRVPVFTKLAEAHHHYMQTSHTHTIFIQIGLEVWKLQAETHLHKKCGVHCAEFHDFIFSMPFQTGLGAPSASCSKGTRAVIPGVKRPGRGVEHPPQTTVKVRMSTVIFLLTLCAFLARYGETFTFTNNYW